ncbi:hypothetical protein [Corynebacterium sp. H130]|uniref:hypothetical protein n=1 Tax=Corynebacterium sp. H130 TaxID=3133444 RepID=UPI0030B0DF78
MSEKQLTVAELMARAAAEGRSDAPRRRRRRSLEDGGISVAELTGSLPKVQAKPEEPRHTSEPIDAPKAEPAKPEPVKEEPAKPEPVKPEPVKSEPKQSVPPVSVIQDNDPIRLTTDSFPAQKAPEKPAVEEKPAVKETPAPAVAFKEAPEERTAQIPPVKEAAQPISQDAEDTGVIPAVVEEPSAVEKPVAVEDEDEDDERVSIVSVLLMVVAGLAIGAAIFLGFKELWANVNPMLTGALAGVMTLGIVGVVHALRTERDGLSMALAAVTGLAVTFGPLLIVGL